MHQSSPAGYRWANLSILAPVLLMAGSVGCAHVGEHWTHYWHQHSLVADMTEKHQDRYYHCPHCGQIVPREGFYKCPRCLSPAAFYGYHATCWRQFPDGWGCPPETVANHPDFWEQGLLDSNVVVEEPIIAPQHDHQAPSSGDDADQQQINPQEGRPEQNGDGAKQSESSDEVFVEPPRFDAAERTKLPRGKSTESVPEPTSVATRPLPPVAIIDRGAPAEPIPAPSLQSADEDFNSVKIEQEPPTEAVGAVRHSPAESIDQIASMTPSGPAPSPQPTPALIPQITKHAAEPGPVPGQRQIDQPAAPKAAVAESNQPAVPNSAAVPCSESQDLIAKQSSTVRAGEKIVPADSLGPIPLRRIVWSISTVEKSTTAEMAAAKVANRRQPASAGSSRLTTSDVQPHRATTVSASSTATTNAPKPVNRIALPIIHRTEASESTLANSAVGTSATVPAPTQVAPATAQEHFPTRVNRIPVSE